MSVAIPFKAPLDLHRNEIQNHRLQNLSTPPASPVNGLIYFDTDLACAMVYDAVRSKWLSEALVTLQVGRTGAAAPGTSLRMAPDVPMSTTPFKAPRNLTLIGITIATSTPEQFTLRIDDVIGGSSTQLAILHAAAGPVATTSYIDNTLNSDFNLNDSIDVYILSSLTGNISNPIVKLFFKYRK